MKKVDKFKPIERTIPIPAAFQPGEWGIVNDDVPRTNKKERKMWVPFGPDGELSRLDEISHVAYSPMSFESDVSERSIMAAEDMRMRLINIRSGINPVASRSDLAFVSATLSDMFCNPKFSRLGFARLMVAGYFVKNVRSLITRKTTEFVKAASSLSPAQQATAADLVTMLGLIKDQMKVVQGSGNRSVDLTMWVAEWLDETFGGSKSTGGGRLVDAGEPKKAFDWVVPMVFEDNLDMVASGDISKSRTLLYKNYGSIPKKWARWPTSRRVFEKRPPALGCSVLIDCSGSMGNIQAAVEELLDVVNMAWVAAYSGNQFHIIAKGGRYSSTPVSYWAPGTNESDLPSLRLLAKQPGPRFWISDGGITVAGDCAPTWEQRDEVSDFTRANGIRMLWRVGDMLNPG